MIIILEAFLKRHARVFAKSVMQPLIKGFRLDSPPEHFAVLFEYRGLSGEVQFSSSLEEFKKFLYENIVAYCMDTK